MKILKGAALVFALYWIIKMIASFIVLRKSIKELKEIENEIARQNIKGKQRANKTKGEI